MLEKEGDFEVTVCGPQDDIVNIALNGAFDVMLFDLNMPGLSGIELSKRVLELLPDALILIYSGFDLTPHFGQLVDLGVAGFVSKSSNQDRLVQAIRCVLNRETIVPIKLLRSLRREGSGRPDFSSSAVYLTEREIEILREVAKGKSNKMIAEKMHVSQRTLEYALTQVFHKLSVHSRVEAVNKARSMGILLDEHFLVT